jgi:hypothetical protein
VLLLLLAGSAFGQKTDWEKYFKPGISPGYPLTGTLTGVTFGDYHASYTDADGNTSRWTCSTTTNSVDCSDGPGASFYLVEPDGTSLMVGKPDVYSEPPNWRMDPEVDAILGHYDVRSRAPQIFHFRVRYLIVGKMTVPQVCVPVPGTEALPEGKMRKEWAKKHRMEDCYFTVIDAPGQGPLSIK